MVFAGHPFGKRVLQARLNLAAREGRPVSQAEIADLMGVHQKTVATWEHGKKEPDLDTITRLIFHFGFFDVSSTVGGVSAPDPATCCQVSVATAILEFFTPQMYRSNERRVSGDHLRDDYTTFGPNLFREFISGTASIPYTFSGRTEANITGGGPYAHSTATVYARLIGVDAFGADPSITQSAVFDDFGNGTFTTTPEPSSLALLGTGLLGLVPIVRRRKARS